MPGLVQTLQALRIRNFRYLWLSHTLSYFIQRMEVLVLGWLVLELTNSPFLVGLIGALRFGGSLIGPLAGVVADRFNRRQLLLLVQCLILVQMGGMFLLIWKGWLQAWHIFAITLLGGVNRAFEWPTQQALTADLVQEEELANGVALINAASNVTSILGPALGGVVLAWFGPGACYGLLFVIGLLQMATLYQIRMPSPMAKGKEHSLWQEIRTGVHYSAHHPLVLAALATAVLINLLGFPLTFSLMPVFARDILAVGADGLGFLTAAVGGGSLLGSLLVASRGTLHQAAPLMLGGTLGWMGSMILFALLPWYLPALLVLGVMGIAQGLSMANIAILILGHTTPEMRGRIMGLRSMAICALPVGSLVAGAATELLGAPLTVLLSGILGIGLMCGIHRQFLRVANPSLTRLS